ncbi:MAG: hypothetical protein FJ276_33350, partial [Planctomycetes bacterium]|nr:hypothetical protein [Planctomycetota bacterium]
MDCSRKTRMRRRTLFLETLEKRELLHAASLVDDSYDARQNADAATLQVLANDVFGDRYAGERLITAVSYGSQGGRIEIADGGQSLRYSPPADYAGVEGFVYFVDGQYSANVTINIVSPLRDDSFTVLPNGQPGVLDVLRNDPFWAGYHGPRKITATSATGLGGRLQITADGRSIRYTPPDHDYGEDTFVYIVDERYPAEVT